MLVFGYWIDAILVFSLYIFFESACILEYPWYWYKIQPLFFTASHSGFITLLQLFFILLLSCLIARNGQTVEVTGGAGSGAVRGQVGKWLSQPNLGARVLVGLA